MARMLRQVARPSLGREDEGLPRCGWFDSSHELHSGLNVTVHDSAGSVAALLPLNWWLQWELDAMSQPVAVQRGASPSGLH